MVKVKDRGWKSAGQLRRLFHVGPQASRELFHATVVSRTNYAAVAWYSHHLGSKPNYVTGRVLFPIQKLGAQAVVKCFNTMSSESASAEAPLATPHVRLQLKIARFWVEVHSLPENNPIKQQLRKVREIVPSQKKFPVRSPLQHMGIHLQGPELSMEIVPAWTTPPWETCPTGARAWLSADDATAKHNTEINTHIQVYASSDLFIG